MLPTVRRALFLLTGAALSVPLTLAAPGTSGAVDSAARQQTTTVSLTVTGCDGCQIQPVQNKRGDVTYSGPTKTATGEEDLVRFTVPTRRTSKMAFLVYAPFDEFAENGIPATAITAFRAKNPGATVNRQYVRKTRTASSCWDGTRRSEVSNTLVVRQVQVRNRLLGPGKHDVVAAYFTKTLPSAPFYEKTPKNAAHASDPSICK